MSVLQQIYHHHRRFFDERAAGWHLPPADRQQILNLANKMNLRPGMRVLDVGCGTGAVTELIIRSSPGITVYGIDLAFEMLRRCRRETHLQGTIQSYSEQLPFAAQSLDVIINYCVFPHIQFPEKALGEYHRVLKSNCPVLIIHPGGRQQTNHKHQTIGFPVSRDLLPRKKELIKLLQKTGFQVKEIRDTREIFFIAAIAVG